MAHRGLGFACMRLHQHSAAELQLDVAQIQAHTQNKYVHLHLHNNVCLTVIFVDNPTIAKHVGVKSTLGDLASRDMHAVWPFADTLHPPSCIPTSYLHEHISS